MIQLLFNWKQVVKRFSFAAALHLKKFDLRAQISSHCLTPTTGIVPANSRAGFSMSASAVQFLCFAILVFLFSIISFDVRSQVSSYCFTQSNGTYSAISGGTSHGVVDDAQYTSIAIGFTFNFNGTNYTTCSISSNGFITFGATAPGTTNYTPISSTTGYSGAISAMGRDGEPTGSLRSQTLGSAPNRTFVIQWATWKRYSGTTIQSGDNMNFQIILYETTNRISIVYGSNVCNTTSLTVQVGLRGAANTDFKNRKTAPWASTVAGTVNTDNINTVNTSVPASGLTFTFMPGTVATPGTINGTASVCQGHNGEAYSVAAFSGALTYSWTLPANAFIASGSGTNSITVNFASNAASGNINIAGNNGCTTGATSAYAVTVNAIPATPTATITSNSPQCNTVQISRSGNTPPAGETWYWQSASSGTDQSNSGTTYNVTASGTYYLRSQNSGGCWSAAQSSPAVTVNTVPAQPGAFTAGSSTPCAGASNTYTVPAVGGATSYTWSYSGTGATFNASTATPTQIFSFASSATSGTLSVSAVNGCGTGTARTMALTITPSLIANGGSDKIVNCGGGSVTLDGSYTLSTGGSCSAVTLFSENFESYAAMDGLPATWLESVGTASVNNWGIIGTAYITGSRSLSIYNNTTQKSYSITDNCDKIAYIATAINATGYTGLLLNFKWQCTGEATYDYGTVVYSTGGGPWTNVSATQYSGSAATSTVTNLSLSVVNGTQFYIGFRWINDALVGTNPPFTVDDITITGIPTWCNSATIAWSSGAIPSTSLTPTVTSTGTYTLSITAGNSCVTTDQVTASPPTPPNNPGNPTASAAPHCVSLGVTLTRSGSPPAGETWYWQTSAGGTDLTYSGSTYAVTSSGTYYIRSRNNTTQCWSAGAGGLAVTVNANPSVSISPATASVCSGTPVDLTASGASTYAWSPATGLNQTTGATVTATPSSTTTYTVVGTDGNGCTGSTTRQVTVGSIPAAPTGVTPAATSICSGQSINLNATSAGNAIRWYTVSSGGANIGTSASGANFSVSPSSNTTYYAEAYTTLNCASTTRTATGLITVVARPSAPTVTGDYTCDNGVVTLSASGAGAGENYKWYDAVSGGNLLQTNGASYNTPSISTTTTYYVVKYQTASPFCESTPRTAVTASIIKTGLDVYSVTRTTGITYTDISAGGTNVGSWKNGTSTDDNLSNSISLPFSFSYDGSWHTALLISVDGFVTFNIATKANGENLPACGDVEPYTYENDIFTQYTGKKGTLQAIAPFYNDLYCNSSLTASIHYTTSGTAPNRIFKVQWKNMSNDIYCDDDCTESNGNLNFQVWLYETSGNIEFYYGSTQTQTSYSCSSGSCTIDNDYTVGINSASLSASPTIYQLLTQQTANTATFSNTAQNNLTTLPTTSSKITLTRTAPVSATAVPACAILYNYPSNNATNQCLNTTLSWNGQDQSPTSYDVYFGTTNPPSFIGNQSGDYYNPGTLAASTTYYWKIVPRNSFGTAVSGVPTYSFTTGVGDRQPIEILSSVGTLSSHTYNYTDAYGRAIYTNTYEICESQMSGTLTASNFSLSEGSELNWTNPVYFFGWPIVTCTDAIPTDLWGDCSGSTQSPILNFVSWFTAMFNGGYIIYDVFTRGCNANVGCTRIIFHLNDDNKAPTGITVSANPICNGSSTTLTQTGGNLSPGASYKWYSGSCGGTLVGTGSSVNVSPSVTTNYYVRVEGGTVCATTTSCRSTTITVQSSLANNTISASQTICSGSTPASLTGSTPTGGSGTYNYLWESSTTSGSSNFSTANGTSNAKDYSPGALTVNTWYRRQVTSGACTTPLISTAIQITINALPAISAHPSNSTICAGANTSFSVTGSGAGIAYQWQVNTGSGFNNISNGGVYSGATSSTLSITTATAGMNTYQYRCVVSGTCTPSITSNTATLTVNTAPAISAHPSNQSICSGNNAAFSVSALGTAITYQWQVNTGSGFSNVSNGGVYSGATAATLNITGATTGMNGYQYQCVVSGTCSPSATSNVATLTVNIAPTISAHPSDQIICSGNNASFSITASGTALTYQWQVNTGSGFNNISNGGVYSGASASTLNITSATAGMNTYQYRCVVSGTCTPSVTSNTATLTVNTAPAISAHPSNQSICSGSNISFSVTTSGTALTYQWQVNTGSGFNNVTNGGAYSGATTSALNITSATTSMNGYQYQCVISGTCSPSATSNTATLTINVAPSVSAHPSNSTICAGNNTSFSVTASGSGLTYQWQVNTGSGFSNVSNGGVYSGAMSSSLSITSAISGMNSYQYQCIVTGSCSPTATSNPATLTVNIAPNISAHPSNQIICSGSDASFSVTASGTALTYQWQENTGSGFLNISNGGVYSGATASTLNITGITAGMDGNEYQCVVSGTCSPSATSNVALLTFGSTPSIGAHPSNSIVCSEYNTSFSVTASGSGLVYQWQVNTGSGFNNVSNGGVYSGAAASALNITGAPNNMNSYQFQCIVSSGACPISSNSAMITVHPSPSAPVGPDKNRCGIGVVILVAESPVGCAVDWYAGSIGGTVLNGGNGTSSYTTPSLSETTQFFVESRNTSTGCLSVSRTTITVNILERNQPASTWNGIVDTDWFNDENWSHCVPGNITVATIPNGMTNNPVITETSSLDSGNPKGIARAKKMYVGTTGTGAIATLLIVTDTELRVNE